MNLWVRGKMGEMDTITSQLEEKVKKLMEMINNG